MTEEPHIDWTQHENLLDRLLSRWTGFLYRHYLAVLAIALVLTAAASTTIFKIDLAADISSLLPEDSPALNAFLDSRELFGADLTVGVVWTDEGSPVTDHLLFLDLLAERLGESDRVARVDYRVIEKIPIRRILPFLPLLLSDQEMDALAARLQPEAIREQIALDKRTLISMPSPTVKRFIQQDPLMLLEVLRERMARGFSGFSMDLSEGYYLSKNGSTLLIFVRPTGIASDIRFDKALTEELDAILQDARREYIEEGYGDADDIEDLQIGFTGPHIIAAHESRVIRAEAQRAIILSLIGVVLLFTFAFRRTGAILYVGLPLFAGVVWSLGFAYITIGHLNLVTSAFAAIILGLGADFAIHIFNRFLDHRSEGYSTLESLEVAMMESGRGVITGALTTSAAFFSMTIYKFKGIRELGFMAGSGILICLIIMLSVLPAILVARSRWFRRFQPRRLFGFGSEMVVGWSLRHSKAILIVGLGVTVVLAIAATQITWSGRVGGGAARYELNPALRLQQRVKEEFGGSFKGMLLLLKGRDFDALDRTAREAHTRLEAMEGRGVLSSVESLWSYLPSPEDQERRLVKLREVGVRWDVVQAALLEALAEEGFRKEAFSGYLEALEVALSRDRPLASEELLDLTDTPFVEAFLQSRESMVSAAIHMYPAAESFTAQDVEAVQATLRDLPNSPGSVHVQLAGATILGQELKMRTRTGFFAVTVAALVLILGILYLHFRSPLLVLLLLTPLLAAIAWLLGMMALLKIQINVMNVAVTPMILGIGIDDGIFVLNAYLHEGRRDVRQTYRITGKAVAMTTFTTCVGFGSLAFADHPGLASMGWLAMLGVSLCLVATLTLLPALMRRFLVRRGS